MELTVQVSLCKAILFEVEQGKKRSLGKAELFSIRFNIFVSARKVQRVKIGNQMANGLESLEKS